MSFLRRWRHFPGFLLGCLLLAPSGPAAARELPAFTALKTLVGDWEGVEKDGAGVRVTYELVADGSALRETMSMGPTPAMLSVYHQDGDQLLMTHYCLNGTQSRMRTKSLAAGAKRIDFQYHDATNVLRATQGFMNGVLFELEDADRFTQTWSAAAMPEKPVGIRFARLKGRPPKLAHQFPPGKPSKSPAYEKIRSLEGRWSCEQIDGEKRVTLIYQPVAAGQAVVEVWDDGRTQPMITVYYEDGADVMLTHYCTVNAQPRMRAAGVRGEPKSIAFDYLDATNMMHGRAATMNRVRFDFEAPGRFLQTWYSESPSNPPMRLRCRRAKDSAR